MLIATQLSSCRGRGPLLGKDPIANPLVVEDHSEALAYWAEKGVRDAVLVNFDTHDDLRWIPESKSKQLAGIYRRREWQRFRDADSSAENGLYHLGNWILAGHRLGIVRETVWVIPFALLSMDDSAEKMRRFLKDYEFSEDDIHTFVLKEGRFTGTVHGVPLTICDAGTLPLFDSPLLLSIDTDFFPPYSTVQEKPYLQALQNVFQALHARQYRILEAVVSYSVNGDYLPPHLRWVGDTALEILKNPRLLDSQPSQRLLLMQELDNLYRDNDPSGVLKLAEEWLRQGTQDSASLAAYRALSCVLQGDAEQAFAAAQESCRLDPRYCTLYPYIGTYWYSAGKYRNAERFYLAGFAADPEMASGLFQYGHCLARMGRTKEALAWYERDEAKNGVFPSRFLVMEMQLLLKDTAAAQASLARAVDGLRANRYAEVVNDETARAIYTALDFCQKEGLVEYSSALRSNPAVIRMFTAYPRS